VGGEEGRGGVLQLGLSPFWGYSQDLKEVLKALNCEELIYIYSQFKFT